jgi:hypothetical protein
MTGEQIVAEIDRAQRREPCVVTVEPAFDGVAFAVLFFGAVLGADELGHQGNDLGKAGRHDGGRQQAMITFDLAVGALAREAVRTADFLGTMILRSVPGDQGSATQSTEGLPHGGLGQQRLHAFETGLQKRGVCLVERAADIIVGRNSSDAEQGLAVGAALTLLQRALKGQKRRTLHEEHRERSQTEVRDRDIAATPLS